MENRANAPSVRVGESTAGRRRQLGSGPGTPLMRAVQLHRAEHAPRDCSAALNVMGREGQASAWRSRAAGHRALPLSVLQHGEGTVKQEGEGCRVEASRPELGACALAAVKVRLAPSVSGLC